MISCFFEQSQCLYFGSPVLDTLSQLESSSTQDPGLLPMQSPVLLNGYPSYSSPVLQHPQRKMGKLPKETTDILKAWLHHHSDHPHPSEKEKLQLCHATGFSMNQVTNWFVNVSVTDQYVTLLITCNQQARRRILAPACPPTVSRNVPDPISSSTPVSPEFPIGGKLPANIGISPPPQMEKYPPTFYGAQDDLRPVSIYGNQNEYNPQDRKTGLYKSKLCRSWEEIGSCRYGAKCRFSHGKDELESVLRHPKVNVSCQCY